MPHSEFDQHSTITQLICFTWSILIWHFSPRYFSFFIITPAPWGCEGEFKDNKLSVFPYLVFAPARVSSFSLMPLLWSLWHCVCSAHFLLMLQCPTKTSPKLSQENYDSHTCLIHSKYIKGKAQLALSTGKSWLTTFGGTKPQTDAPCCPCVATDLFVKRWFQQSHLLCSQI